MSEEYIKQLEESNNKLIAALDEHRNQVELFRYIMNNCTMKMILDKSGDVLFKYVGNVIDNDEDKRLVNAYKTIKKMGTITIQDLEKELNNFSN
jgi:site-specific DNA-adenine methylase